MARNDAREDAVTRLVEVLLDLEADAGPVTASVADLATRSDLSIRRLQRAAAWLIDAGTLERTPQRTASGGPTSSAWRVLGRSVVTTPGDNRLSPPPSGLAADHPAIVETRFVIQDEPLPYDGDAAADLALPGEVAAALAAPPGQLALTGLGTVGTVGRSRHPATPPPRRGPRGGKAPRGELFPLPADYALTPAMAAWAVGAKLPELEVAAEFRLHRAWCEAHGARYTVRGWGGAAWRTWVLRLLARRAQDPRSQEPVIDFSYLDEGVTR